MQVKVCNAAQMCFLASAQSQLVWYWLLRYVAYICIYVRATFSTQLVSQTSPAAWQLGDPGEKAQFQQHCGREKR